MKRLLLLLCFITPQVFAWGVTGHLVINQIAYEHLTPKARQQVDSLVTTFAKTYPQYNNFLIDGNWADYIRQTGVNAFNNWHYINQPFSNDDRYRLPHYAKTNVVWAIQQSEQTLESPNADPFSRALFLVFLTHLVADVHQPLHAAVLYSRKFPKGDQGGNLYLIKNKYAPNLHSYWDQGADFYWQQRGTTELSTTGIKELAQKIQHDYPEIFFGARSQQLDPMAWAEESFLIAKNFAYITPYNKPLSKAYQQQAQALVEQQTALAGYRLANTLNQILG